MTNRPNFTQEQKDFICWQIGEWYLQMKPLLEGQHNLGYMKEKLKLMVCDETDPLFESTGFSTPSILAPGLNKHE